MAKFLTGEKLRESIYNLIYDAKRFLIIISPYIKLDKYLKVLLDKQMENPRLQIIIIFGKNESAISKSVSTSDLEYFKGFPNISITYVKDLHAKYYGNEKYQIVTSLNLHEYSLKNNIEFGIKLHAWSWFKSERLDIDAWKNYFYLIKNFPVVYLRVPMIKTRLLALDVIGSKTIYDVTDHFLNNNEIPFKTLFDFKGYIDIENKFPKTRPSRIDVEGIFDEVKVEDKIRNVSKKLQNEKGFPSISNDIQDKDQNGFCIICRAKIFLNPLIPFCGDCKPLGVDYDIYKLNFYCHICGKSHKTSLKRPACKTCYYDNNSMLQFMKS